MTAEPWYPIPAHEPYPLLAGGDLFQECECGHRLAWHNTQGVCKFYGCPCSAFVPDEEEERGDGE